MYQHTYFKNIVLQVVVYVHAVYITATPQIYQAVVSVPVADLIGQPFSKSHPHDRVHRKYNTIPFDAKTSSGACLRVHQLLLHEQVSVIDQQGDEVCVLIPHLFYYACEHRKTDNVLDTEKKHYTDSTVTKK